MLSCLICGYEKPFKAWVVNKEGDAVAGVCEDCLNHARDYARLEAQTAVLRDAIDAAIYEGLRERISEVGYSYGDGSLADLVSRRILYAFDTTDAGRETEVKK